MTKRIFITSDRIGHSDDELGHVLMKNFLYSLARNDVKPLAIMLMNEGVRLSCADSPSLDDLLLLAENGVPVTVCGTCLDYFGLTDALSVGEIATMPGSVAALMADDVLSIG